MERGRSILILKVHDQGDWYILERFTADLFIQMLHNSTNKT